METLIFMIIIGVISAIFGKGKVKNNQPKGKSFLSGGFEEIKTLINNQIDSTQQGNFQKNKDLKPQRITPVGIEQKYLDIKAQEMKVEEVPQPVMQAWNAEQIKPKVDEDNQLHSEDWNAQTILNGIIWSEIIGEPRSKKPHYLRKG